MCNIGLKKVICPLLREMIESLREASKGFYDGELAFGNELSGLEPKLDVFASAELVQELDQMPAVAATDGVAAVAAVVADGVAVARLDACFDAGADPEDGAPFLGGFSPPPGILGAPPPPDLVFAPAGGCDAGGGASASPRALPRALA